MQSSEKLLYNLAFSKNISHASIFECSDSHTSLKIAKDIVKILICNDKQNRPCNVCSNCIKINKDSHADVKFIGLSEADNSIKVDDIRFILSDCFIASNEGSCKFYIIKNADYMTIQAQNALIKVLEEPPKNVYFILLCKYSTNLLETIRSRSQIFSIGCEDNSENEEFILSKDILESVFDGNEIELLKLFSRIPNNRKFLKSIIENIIVGLLNSDKIENMNLYKLTVVIHELKNIIGLIDKNINFNLIVTMTYAVLRRNVCIKF